MDTSKGQSGRIQAAWAALRNWRAQQARALPTLDEARAAYLSACAHGDAEARERAWCDLQDVHALTAGAGCV